MRGLSEQVVRKAPQKFHAPILNRLAIALCSYGQFHSYYDMYCSPVASDTVESRVKLATGAHLELEGGSSEPAGLLNFLINVG